MADKVKLVKWGDIEDPNKAPLWGLRVGPAYVAQRGKALLFDTRQAANAEKRKLQAKLEASQ